MSAHPFQPILRVPILDSNYELPRADRGSDLAVDLLAVSKDLFAKAVEIGSNGKPKTRRNITYRSPLGPTVRRTSESSATDYGLYIDGLAQSDCPYNQVGILSVLDGSYFSLSFDNHATSVGGNASIKWKRGNQVELWGSKLDYNLTLGGNTSCSSLAPRTYNQLLDDEPGFIEGLVGTLATAQATIRGELRPSKQPGDMLHAFAMNRSEQYPDSYDPGSKELSSVAQRANQVFTNTLDRIMESAFYFKHSR